MKALSTAVAVNVLKPFVRPLSVSVNMFFRKSAELGTAVVAFAFTYVRSAVKLANSACFKMDLPFSVVDMAVISASVIVVGFPFWLIAKAVYSWAATSKTATNENHIGDSTKKIIQHYMMGGDTSLSC